MSGLEYIGALAIMGIFFWALVNLSPRDPNWEKDQLPEFGLEPTKAVSYTHLTLPTNREV